LNNLKSKIQLSLINFTLGLLISLVVHSAIANQPDTTPNGQEPALDSVFAQLLADWDDNSPLTANLSSITGSGSSTVGLASSDGTIIAQGKSGSLLIGTDQSTAAKVKVEGGVKISDTQEPCTTDLNGALRFHQNQLEICTGTAWTASCDLGDSGPTCSSCTLNGVNLNHGESKIFYQYDDRRCDTRKSNRTCLNGHLSGSNYQNTECCMNTYTCSSKRIYATDSCTNEQTQYQDCTNSSIYTGCINNRQNCCTKSTTSWVCSNNKLYYKDTCGRIYGRVKEECAQGCSSGSSTCNCTNGATNPPDCDSCGAGYTYSGGSCVQTTYQWHEGDWSSCNSSCKQARSVVCKNNLGVVVSDSYCPGVKPIVSKSCNEDYVSEWLFGFSICATP
jgi:hypothetical protein